MRRKLIRNGRIKQRQPDERGNGRQPLQNLRGNL
jgi:hypothetical protein